jgi:hypothetical protein
VRIAAILVSLGYLLSTSGFTVAKHYCQGELESVSLIGTGNCCCEDEHSSSSCCDNEFVQLKVADEHAGVSALTLNHDLVLLISAFPVTDHLAEIPGDNAYTRPLIDPPISPHSVITRCSFRC